MKLLRVVLNESRMLVVRIHQIGGMDMHVLICCMPRLIQDSIVREEREIERLKPQRQKESGERFGYLIKFPKRKQDLKVDLPTIGLKTFKQSKTAGLKGIVIKSKQHVFLDKNKCIKFANKNKMFISVK